MMKRTPLEPYRRPMPRVLGGSKGEVRFLMSEVPLYDPFSQETIRKTTQIRFHAPRLGGDGMIPPPRPLKLRGLFRGTSLIRKRTPLEPYRRPMPRVLGGS